MNFKDISIRPIPSGRIGRIAKTIAAKTDLKTAEKIMCDYAEFDKISSNNKKAEWIKKMMVRFEETIKSQELRDEIMESCGKKCCGKTTRKKAKEIFQHSANIKEFLQKLNKTGIGGGRLILKNKNTITGGYDHCYCGQVKKTAEPFPDAQYCQCSVGWYKQLFSSALEKEIEVELVQSIITGADSCEFLIHI